MRREHSQSDNANYGTGVQYKQKTIIVVGNKLALFLSFSCCSGVLSLSLSLSLSGFDSTSLSLICYLHNCLSPPLAAGEVELSQRYRGNTD